jgi:hypothetical protein
MENQLVFVVGQIINKHIINNIITVQCIKKIIYDIKTSFSNMIIKYLYDNKNINDVRVLFKCDNFSDKNKLICNGLILSFNKFKNIKLLVLPSPMLIPYDHYIHEENENISITPLYNGTILNLYFYKNRWNMSTSLGIEMNYVSWDKDYTFSKMLEDTRFNFNTLDKKYCYSIILCHPKLNLIETYCYYYIIQRVNLCTYHKQYKVDKSISNIPILYNFDLSIDDKSIDNFCKYNFIFYGYILEKNNVKYKYSSKLHNYLTDNIYYKLNENNKLFIILQDYMLNKDNSVVYYAVSYTHLTLPTTR